MAESVVARESTIPDAIRRGILHVLPDRSGFVVLLDPSAPPVGCPVCDTVMLFGVLTQELAPAPAGSRSTWSYRCFGCATPRQVVADEVAA